MASTSKSLQNLLLKFRSSENLYRVWMYGESSKFKAVNSQLSKSNENHITYHYTENFRWSGEKQFCNGSKLPLVAAAIFGLGIVKNKEAKSSDDPDLEEKMEIENRVRQYSGRHDVFDFFASYKDEDKKGELRGLMGVKDFCASVTPGSKPSELFGACNYKILPTGYERSRELVVIKLVPDCTCLY